MSIPSPGDLYQHHSGGLVRIDALSASDSDASATIVYSSLDPRHDGLRYAKRLSMFSRTVRDAGGVERPCFARVQMPGCGAIERFAYRSCSLPVRLIDAVMARYRDPTRFYHASWHIHDLFARAAQAGTRLTNAQIIAILFHDAVYVPGAPQGMNERMSASLLRQWAPLDHSDDVACACRMIEDTADRVPRSPGSEQIIALDLASLADSPVNFDAYTEMVWLEERHLFEAHTDPKAQFMRARVKKLRQLAETADGRVMQAGFRAAFKANLERMRP